MASRVVVMWAGGFAGILGMVDVGVSHAFVWLVRELRARGVSGIGIAGTWALLSCRPPSAQQLG